MIPSTLDDGDVKLEVQAQSLYRRLLMSDTDAKSRLTIRATLLAIFGFPLLIVLSCGGFLAMWGRDELLAEFTTVHKNYAIRVYAEPAFHYEPPGYLYFELANWGEIQIPRRRFMGIGSERTPGSQFRLLETPDNEVIALVLDSEVQMIHEFSSGYTWPGPYTNVTEIQWQVAERLIPRLQEVEPTLRCPRQTDYRRELDRLQAKVSGNRSNAQQTGSHR